MPLTVGATYYFCAVLETRDERGRRILGRPSAPVSIVCGAAALVNVSLYGLYPDPGFEAPDLKYYSLYATGPDPVELIFYRIHSAPVIVWPETFTHSDEAAIDGAEVLYTDSGELPNFPPPPSSALVQWRNRLVALDSETARVWVSKPGNDTEWPGFHLGLSVDVNVHVRRPKFMSVQDDKLVIWWDDAIGVMWGEPGDVFGANTTLQPPQLLSQRGIGLRERRSVLHTPLGTMFMSNMGLYLLDAGLQLTWLGRPIDDFRDKTIVGAMVVQNALDANGASSPQKFSMEARFYCSDGTVLAYDIDTQKWRTDAIAIGTVVGVARPSSFNATPVAHNGVIVAAHDKVWEQVDPTAASGGLNEDVSGVFETEWISPWIKPQGVFGGLRVQRVFVLGRFLAAATIAVAYDYAAAYVETKAGFGSNTDSQFVELELQRQPCAAFRLRVRGFSKLVGVRATYQPDETFRRTTTRA